MQENTAGSAEQKAIVSRQPTLDQKKKKKKNQYPQRERVTRPNTWQETGMNSSAWTSSSTLGWRVAVFNRLRSTLNPDVWPRSSDPALVETYRMYIHGWCHTRRFKTWSLLFYLMSLQSLAGMIFRTTNVCCALPLPGIRSGLRLPSIGSEIGFGSRGENERVEIFFFKNHKKKVTFQKTFPQFLYLYIYIKKKNHKDLMFKTVRLKRWWNFVSWYRNTFLYQSNLDTERLKSVCVDVCKYIFTYKQIKSYSLDSFGQISASALTNAPPLLWPSSSLSQSGDFLEWFKVWVPFWLPWKRMRSRFGSNLAVKYYNHPGIETITLQKKKKLQKKNLF